MATRKKDKPESPTGKPSRKNQLSKKFYQNIDLSSWDKHFKNSIKKGKSPEADLWDGLQNRFDMGNGHETAWKLPG